MNWHSTSMFLPLFGVALACGGSAMSQQRLVETKSAVEAARQVQADHESPEAALHIQLAEEQIERAQALAKQGDGEEANLVLLRAQSDAELAIQLARTLEQQAEARTAWEKVEELRASKL